MRSPFTFALPPRRTSHLSIALVVAALSAVPHAGWAQSAVPSGAWVRLTLPSRVPAPRLEGRVVRWQADSVAVHWRPILPSGVDSLVGFAWRDVDRVEVLRVRPGGAGRVALGGLAGLAGGLVLGALIGDAGCEVQECYSGLTGAAVGAGVGLVFGIALGAKSGREWESVALPRQ